MTKFSCAGDRVEIHVGDCRDILRELEPASVDACVTDPPYGLTFMGRGWDRGVPGVEFWREVRRVLKPGAYLLAFGGTRTYHRLACAVEDAGFEIRDQIAWVYGQGFPKSLDVSKAIDKAAGAEREVVGVKPGHEAFVGRERHNLNGGWDRPWANDSERAKAYHLATAPATEEAACWQGWGTALKPALEPIVVARKPLDGTVAANVLRHGTGALNIDGCRVESGARPLREIDPKASANGSVYAGRQVAGAGFDGGSRAAGETTQGRWPANLVHDGSDEVLALFPADAGASAKASGRTLRNGNSSVARGRFNGLPEGREPAFHGDAGSAARFFYCAKASRRERGEGNNHPTVKPIALMRWLVRLVTPPGGLVLDPFAGSGTTGIAAGLEGLRAILCEQSPEYAEIARGRLATWLDAPSVEEVESDDPGPLFAGL